MSPIDISKKGKSWGGSDRLQEGISFDTTGSNLEILQKPLHLPPEKLHSDQRSIVLTDVESDEFGVARGTKEDRIRCGWSAFAKHRQELTSKSYVLRHRLHLFDAVVTPTITYRAGTWATTKEHSKCSAMHSAACFDPSSRQQEKNKKKKLGESLVTRVCVGPFAAMVRPI